MKIDKIPYTTIWLDAADNLQIINQLLLPHHLEIVNLKTAEDVFVAIKTMQVRGAGLIGAAAGYGMYLAAKEAPCTSEEEFSTYMLYWATRFKSSRPTARNLAWAVERQLQILHKVSLNEKVYMARHEAVIIAGEDAEFCRQIGEYGKQLFLELMRSKKLHTLNILTHCNAGWLAFVDYGSALSPIYALHDLGVSVHVWVDETRPRNQGAALTCFELAKHGVRHTLISDNTGGHLMQQGLVDVVIVGADRVARNGDTANKIGTYLKALAAQDNDIPFYVALPSSTFDFSLANGQAIPIEQRDAAEVRFMTGINNEGQVESVRICPEETPGANWSFDVTPARLITGMITERGVTAPDLLGDLFPEAIVSEGVIKYTAIHNSKPVFLTLEQNSCLAKVNIMRTKLYAKKYIGSSNGISFGNVSCRLPAEPDLFMITACNTGQASQLDLTQYTCVHKIDVLQNQVHTQGLHDASSEAMTHGVVYEGNAQVNFVWHGHDAKLFSYLVEHQYLNTPVSLAYGTPELALAVKKLVAGQEGVFAFVTLGHINGIFICGNDLEEMWNFLAQLSQQAIKS